MSQLTDKIAFGVIIHKYVKNPSTSPTFTAEQVEKLWTLASKYQKIQENGCNRSLTIDEIKDEGMIENSINKILAEHFTGVTADFSGDPRGYVVKIHFPGNEYNTWGGAESGYGIG